MVKYGRLGHLVISTKPYRVELVQTHGSGNVGPMPGDVTHSCLPVLQIALFMFLLAAHIFSTISKEKSCTASLKGIVQRDLTGVETRLKRSVLMNYIVAEIAF
jgi:hypothetical protein